VEVWKRLLRKRPQGKPKALRKVSFLVANLPTAPAVFASVRSKRRENLRKWRCRHVTHRDLNLQCEGITRERSPLDRASVRYRMLSGAALSTIRSASARRHEEFDAGDESNHSGRNSAALAIFRVADAPDGDGRHKRPLHRRLLTHQRVFSRTDSVMAEYDDLEFKRPSAQNSNGRLVARKPRSSIPLTLGRNREND